MPESHYCPRRGFLASEDPDTWRADDTCSYCGSVKPDVLMARLELGDIELGPTDKSYKVYVRNLGGAPIGMKAYLQHLSDDQKRRFVDLYNTPSDNVEDKPWMRIGYPGHFYVLPFFMGPAGP